MQLFKQIVGYSLMTVFVSFLMYKFYKSVEHMDSAGLIVWLACVIVLIIFFAVRRVLIN